MDGIKYISKLMLNVIFFYFTLITITILPFILPFICLRRTVPHHLSLNLLSPTDDNDGDDDEPLNTVDVPLPLDDIPQGHLSMN